MLRENTGCAHQRANAGNDNDTACAHQRARKESYHCVHLTKSCDQFKNWAPGKIFIIDDTYEHEVWNDTDEERVVLLLDFNRPMRIGGRFMNWLLMKIMKLTAFYQEPKKNIQDFEARFEAATKRASENLEKLSDL